MSGINIDELADSVNDILVEYSTEVDNLMQTKVEETAKKIHEFMKTQLVVVPGIYGLKVRAPCP